MLVMYKDVGYTEGGYGCLIAQYQSRMVSQASVIARCSVVSLLVEEEGCGLEGLEGVLGLVP
jgi:hypothetical protein